MRDNVLVFPAESGCDIYRALRYNVHFDVFGASGKNDYAEFVYPQNKLFISKGLYITNPDFVKNMNELISKWNIKFIIPSHDTIAKILMQNEDKINCTIICSPLETAEIAEDKYKMYLSLKDSDYYPKVYENISSDIEFPVFLKPYVAAGGKGTVKVNSFDELKKYTAEKKDLLICEYLPGEEYTVDCFTTKNRELAFVGARKRERITNGITYSATQFDLTDEIKNIAADLNKRFKFRGLWWFQLKEDKNNKLKLMEFSVRHAGTMSFYRQYGVNFPLLALFDFMNYEVSILKNNVKLTLDRGIETSYRLDYSYDTIYLDYDDTVYTDDKVNLNVIHLIFQAHNKNKKVVLLTKHDGDLEESLMKFHLTKGNFDEIILIKPDSKKSDYIKHENAIFIDNYFPERLDVSKKCGIPVFDVDAVECLIENN